MTGHLPSSMREPDFMELVCENGEVLVRGLSSKKTKYSSLSSSRYLSQTSKDGVADSTLADPISGVSSLTKQQLVDSTSVQVNKLKEKKTRVDEDEDRAPQALLESNRPSSGATRAEFVKPLPPNSSNPFENDGNPEQIAESSSFCSRGASNCPAYTLERRYEEDTDDLSEDTAMKEEPEEKTKGIKGGKRKRKAEAHILSERKRRDKINKKMRALKELIPNCNKEDKASMLDEAIEYLKNLQFQVQVATQFKFFMQPMMFPSQHLGGYSPMIGMRMQMGLGFGVPPQFPSPLVPGTAALPGNPAARVNMFGFPDEVLSRSMSCSPFVSSAGSLTPESIQLHGAGVSQSAAATGVMGQVNLPGGVNSVSTWKDMNPTQLTQ